MQYPFRTLVFVVLLAGSAVAHGQQATAWASAQWTPMTEENARVFQQVDAQFKADVEADFQARVEAAKAKPPKGASVPPGSGPSVTDSSSSAGLFGSSGASDMPRGKRRPPRPPSVTSLQQLVPSALDFAAPASGGLIVQRMSGSVLFGRTDSEEVVMLPLGAETDLPHGMRGTIREEGKQLRLVVQMATGQVVEYRYDDDPEAPGKAMSVDIHVFGALPGKNVEFKRRYRRAQVNVGELEKAGQ